MFCYFSSLVIAPSDSGYSRRNLLRLSPVWFGNLSALPYCFHLPGSHFASSWILHRIGIGFEKKILEECRFLPIDYCLIHSIVTGNSSQLFNHNQYRIFRLWSSSLITAMLITSNTFRTYIPVSSCQSLSDTLDPLFPFPFARFKA